MVGPYPCVCFWYYSQELLHSLLQQTHTAGWAETSQSPEQRGNSAGRHTVTYFSIRSVTEACWAVFLCNVHAAKLDDVAPWQPGSTVGNTDDFLKECGGNQHCVSVSVTGLNWSWKCVTMTHWNQTESHVNSTFSRVHKSWLCGRPSLLLMHCRHSWQSAFQILIDLQRFLNY